MGADVVSSILTQRSLVLLEICNPTVAERLVANVFEQVVHNMCVSRLKMVP